MLFRVKAPSMPNQIKVGDRAQLEATEAIWCYETEKMRKTKGVFARSSQ